MGNPRCSNGYRRRQIRAWVLATQDTCGICGLLVDKSLKSPDPMSAEVDEIVPVSKGGSPIDRRNVQLVHRICNQKKGNKMQSDCGAYTVPMKDIPIQTSRKW